jgi:hypothetical protein
MNRNEALDLARDVLGITLADERLKEVLAAYADILAAITKLRGLDLSETHPAVIFDPAAGYEERQ